MKTFYTLLLLVCITFFGCKKEELGSGNDTLETLTGTWELRHILGVQVANAPSDFLPGNGLIITFEGSGYRKTSNGKVLDSGTYTLEKKYSQIDGEEYESIMILNSDANKKNP